MNFARGEPGEKHLFEVTFLPIEANMRMCDVEIGEIQDTSQIVHFKIEATNQEKRPFELTYLARLVHMAGNGTAKERKSMENVFLS